MGAAGSGTGEDAMTAHQNHTHEPVPGHAAHYAREGAASTGRAGPHTMPAGGWIKDIATNENWRTTTIVQRHRDRAAITPSP